MPLDFVGIDPETGEEGSPTVWVDTDAHEFVFLGLDAEEALVAKLAGTEWVAGHKTGIPAGETPIRLPFRMIEIIRKACDDAERAGLQ
ncbi:hypothetical protein [Streptomyces sp. CBMA123]|uniref:hypothetical protein n=1 Tax=Streptomyces sp. CBMA123 TaxID=1896313 RepID=UPI001661DB4C|nr:hypothetical protein [Streptomyces sp. CBMA123]MBD0688500.1 hypothetical protein [Streptomyces sp. CBMA123]